MKTLYILPLFVACFLGCRGEKERTYLLGAKLAKESGLELSLKSRIGDSLLLNFKNASNVDKDLYLPIQGTTIYTEFPAACPIALPATQGNMMVRELSVVRLHAGESRVCKIDLNSVVDPHLTPPMSCEIRFYYDDAFVASEFKMMGVLYKPNGKVYSKEILIRIGDGKLK